MCEVTGLVWAAGGDGGGSHRLICCVANVTLIIQVRVKQSGETLAMLIPTPR